LIKKTLQQWIPGKYSGIGGNRYQCQKKQKKKSDPEFYHTSILNREIMNLPNRPYPVVINIGWMSQEEKIGKNKLGFVIKFWMYPERR
jgi:hypothetical protein